MRLSSLRLTLATVVLMTIALILAGMIDFSRHLWLELASVVLGALVLAAIVVIALRLPRKP